MRAPFQILAIPYRMRDGEAQFCVLHRADHDQWQFLSGGGEDDETPEEAARREILEESGLTANPLIPLRSLCCIPTDIFSEEYTRNWPGDTYVIPEYAFGFEGEGELRLSGEHSECAWLDYRAARDRLKWDSNRTALYELNSRLKGGKARKESDALAAGSAAVSIRPFSEKDIDAIRAELYPDLRRDEIGGLVREWNSGSFRGKRFAMFAVLSAGKIVGSISLSEHSKSVASMGVEIFPARRRSGFAYEAARGLIDRARQLGYKVIQDQVRTDNTASIRLHEKLGFETDRYVYQNQREHSVFLFVKTI